MGELATFSAILSKTGLGKAGNECPPKSVIIALGSGIEISNADQYGDNECVKLEDIHKVGYNYYFTLKSHSPVEVQPLPGDIVTVNIESYVLKTVDGVEVGNKIPASISETFQDHFGVVSKILVDSNLCTWELKYKNLNENSTLTPISRTITLTQLDPFSNQPTNKSINISVVQLRAIQTWEYHFNSSSSTVPNPLNIPALGGTHTVTITSYKKEFRNGKPYNNLAVSYNRATNGYGTGNNISVNENKTENEIRFELKWVQAESGKTIIYNVVQAKGVKTYGDITVYLGNVNDISAAGGTSINPNYTYTQLWGWNGNTSNGGTINSGAKVTFSSPISVISLGTTIKPRTKIGVLSITVELNGKVTRKFQDIYQQENKVESTNFSRYDLKPVIANPIMNNDGGETLVNGTITKYILNTYTSGSKKETEDTTFNKDFHISFVKPVPGFTMTKPDGTPGQSPYTKDAKVIVEQNNEETPRECDISFQSIGDPTQKTSLKITQSSAIITWSYNFDINPKSLFFEGKGGGKLINITSTKTKYINGVLVEGSTHPIGFTSLASHNFITPNIPSILVSENPTISPRSGSVNVTQHDSNKNISISINQLGSTFSKKYVLEKVKDFELVPNLGGTVKAYIRSGYYDIVNGTQRDWHGVNVENTVNPDFVTSGTIIQKAGVIDGLQYTHEISITVSANNTEVIREGLVKIRQVDGGDITLNLNLRQSAGTVTYNDILEISTNLISINTPDSGKRSLEITSYREKLINNISVGKQSIEPTTSVVNGNWLTLKKISGPDSTHKYQYDLLFEQNNTEFDRELNLKVQHGDLIKIVNVKQVKGIVDYIYNLSVEPNILPLGPSKVSSAFEVFSYKVKTINGQVLTGERIRVPVNMTVPSLEWLRVNISTLNQNGFCSVVVEENKGELRRATLNIIQSESGKTLDYIIEQAEVSIKWVYELGFNEQNFGGAIDIYFPWDSMNQSREIAIRSYKTKHINGEPDNSTQTYVPYRYDIRHLIGKEVNEWCIVERFNTSLMLHVLSNNTEITENAFQISVKQQIADPGGTVNNSITATVTQRLVPDLQSIRDLYTNVVSTIMVNNKLNRLPFNINSYIQYSSYLAKKRIHVPVEPVFENVPDWISIVPSSLPEGSSFEYDVTIQPYDGTSDRTADIHIRQKGDSNLMVHQYIVQKYHNGTKLKIGVMENSQVPQIAILCNRLPVSDNPEDHYEIERFWVTSQVPIYTFSPHPDFYIKSRIDNYHDNGNLKLALKDLTYNDIPQSIGPANQNPNYYFGPPIYFKNYNNKFNITVSFDNSSLGGNLYISLTDLTPSNVRHELPDGETIGYIELLPTTEDKPPIVINLIYGSTADPYGFA